MSAVDDEVQTAPQSAAAPSPFPPIAAVRVPVGLPHRRAHRARRRHRLALRPALRRAERVRVAARPPGGLLPPRAVRDQRPVQPALRAGHQHPGDDVAHPERLGRRARRADHGPAPLRGHHHAAHPAADRRRRRAPARPHRALHRRQRRDGARVRAGLRLRPRPGRVDARGRRPPRRRRQRGRADDPAAAPTWRSASRATACARATCSPRASELYCALSWAEGLASPADLDDANARLAQTTRFWRTWLSRARLPDHEWMTPIQRSALAIKGLTYMPTGATVAALTTSLPETPGGERNWDYRYTWMRDSTFTLQALHYLNLDWEADEFMQFIADLEPNEDGALQIMYGIDGRRDLTESTRDDLSGYAGARPVRIGNGAFDQRQNDVFGAALDSILLHTRRSNRLPRRLWPIVQAQAECATAVWRQPDQGIWEARGDPQHYVSSKLMGWVALDRAAKLAHIARRAGAQRDLGRDRGGDQGRHPRARPRRARRAAPALRRPTPSTPRPCSRRSSASCPATTSACARACWPSPTSSPSTATCCATGPARPTTGCRARRARSSSARSGSSRPWRSSASASARATSWSACCASPRRWACTPRSSTPTPAGTSATSRRRSRTSR